MVFHGISGFHVSPKISGGQKPWNLYQLLSNITSIHEKQCKLISWKFSIIREYSPNPDIHQFQFIRVVTGRFVVAKGTRTRLLTPTTEKKLVIVIHLNLQIWLKICTIRNWSLYTFWIVCSMTNFLFWVSSVFIWG